jgi:hypothetical protein
MAPLRTLTKAGQTVEAGGVMSDTRKVINRGGGGGLVYFLGLIGSMIYYIQSSDSFWGGVLGVLKALVWPVFLVYEVLKFVAA